MQHRNDEHREARVDDLTMESGWGSEAGHGLGYNVTFQHNSRLL